MENTEISPTNHSNQERIKQVADFLLLVTTSSVPIEIATRSLAGEKLFVWVNPLFPSKEKKYEVIADTVEELTTIVVYVQSNGSQFAADQFGLIAHCDLAFCRKQTGEQYVFTDLKCPQSQYIPPANLGWHIDNESISWFADSAMCLERIRPLVAGEPDPYLIGIGELVFAIGVGIILKKNIAAIKSIFLTRDGRNLWRKYGLDENDAIIRQLDPFTAGAAVMDTILSHIR